MEIMKVIEKLKYSINPPCPKCSYTLGQMRFVDYPCPGCKMDGYRTYDWLVKKKPPWLFRWVKLYSFEEDIPMFLKVEKIWLPRFIALRYFTNRLCVSDDPSVRELGKKMNFMIDGNKEKKERKENIMIPNPQSLTETRNQNG